MSEPNLDYSGKKYRQLVVLEIAYIEAFEGYPAPPSEWEWSDLLGEETKVLFATPVETL